MLMQKMQNKLEQKHKTAITVQTNLFNNIR